MIYRWKGGYSKQAQAQRVGERLDAIRVENDGRLDPRDIVVDARADDSPLHEFFEWRDGVAATKYREMQAREVIRNLVVIYDESPDKPVPAFVCVEKGAEDHGPYQSTRIALAEPESRKYVLDSALRELKAWRKRYADLKELSDVFQSVDAFVLSLESGHEVAA